MVKVVCECVFVDLRCADGCVCDITHCPVEIAMVHEKALDLKFKYSTLHMPHNFLMSLAAGVIGVSQDL